MEASLCAQLGLQIAKLALDFASQLPAGHGYLESCGISTVRACSGGEIGCVLFLMLFNEDASHSAIYEA